jgi:cation transport ATPase
VSGATLRRYAIVFAAALGLVAGLGVRFLAGRPMVADRVFLATILVAGTPLVWRTVRGLVQGRFAADVVAMLAILASVALGQYFAGAVVVLMQSGGEALEAFAMGRACGRDLERAAGPLAVSRWGVPVPVCVVAPGAACCCSYPN